jgi:hypothetical protein
MSESCYREHIISARFLTAMKTGLSSGMVRREVYSMMEVGSISKTSLSFYQTTRRKITERQVIFV